MPYISIECGTLSTEQKELLIEKLTKEAALIMKVPERFFQITVK